MHLRKGYFSDCTDLHELYRHTYMQVYRLTFRYTIIEAKQTRCCVKTNKWLPTRRLASTQASTFPPTS